MTNCILSIQNLSKTYDRQKILQNISFKIPENSIAGIIGPNGAGKSTLLKIISGFELPDKGTIFFKAKEIVSLKEKRLNFSYMPEFLDIYPELYVRDFIEFLNKTVGFVKYNLIEKLALNSVIDKKIKSLSKGFKQRLKLFFALSNNKSFLILDEPFDGFDPLQLLEILELIKSENRLKRSFLISIHQLNDAEKICNYFILLNNGRVVAEGSLIEISKKANLEKASLEQIFIKLIK